MIDVVTPELRPMYVDQLDQMWRQRYEIFLEKLGWDLPAKGAHDRLEKDQFDLPDTIYLLDLDEAKSIRGSARLLPTSGPHLLQVLLPHLTATVPKGDRVWELSRAYFLPEGGPRAEWHRRALRLSLALQELGLLFGIDMVTFQAPKVGVDLFQRHGHAVRTFGPGTDLGDGELVFAGALEVGPGILRRIRTINRVRAPVISLPRVPVAA